MMEEDDRQDDRLDPERIASLFGDGSGGYAFARWGRPVAPVVFGTDDRSLAVIKAAIEAVVTAAGHTMAETDPELGANLMIFFLRSWDEMSEAQELRHILPDHATLPARLTAADAGQYRLFRFDAGGRIRAAFVFLRMQGAQAAMPAAELGLVQAAQAMLRWAPGAFETQPLLARARDGRQMLHPGIANLIRAAYDPILPAATGEPAHAYRLAARMAGIAPARIRLPARDEDTGRKGGPHGDHGDGRDDERHGGRGASRDGD